jgi:hypothetical protein
MNVVSVGSSVTQPQPQCHTAVTCRFTPVIELRLGCGVWTTTRPVNE